jgi:hypothetical protein
MKKHIFFTVFCSVVAFSFCACNSFLTLKPVAEKPSDLDTKTFNGINSFLAGAYSQLQSQGYMNMIIANELYGDNIDFSKAIGLDTWEKEFATYSFSSANQIGQTFWETAYKVIANANVVIDATDKNTYPAEKQQKDQLKGEALTLRAMAHFDLLRHFALPATAEGTKAGIVLRTQPLVTITQAAEKANRSPVTACYTAIITDLTQAITLLPTANTQNKINSHIAKALLARVYHSQNDYEKAFAMADEVIKSGVYKMNTPTNLGMKAIFSAVGDVPVPDGVIFQLVNQQGNDGSQIIRDNFFNNKGGNESLQKYPLSNGLLTALIGERKNLFTQSSGNISFVTKYAQLNNGTTPVNIPLIRLAEMYLIRAEAGLELNVLTVEQARADMNRVRAASQANIDNATTRKEVILEAIRQERRVEFFGEADRWHELRRLKRNNLRNGVNYDDKRSLMKIPNSELKGNVEIEQN